MLRAPVNVTQADMRHCSGMVGTALSRLCPVSQRLRTGPADTAAFTLMGKQCDQDDDGNVNAKEQQQE